MKNVKNLQFSTIAFCKYDDCVVLKLHMILARNDRTIHRVVGQSVAIGDNQFEVIKEFVYLGSLMTPTNDVSLEIQRKIHIQWKEKSRKTEIQVGEWGEQR
jgi:hypothetical protein